CIGLPFSFVMISAMDSLFAFTLSDHFCSRRERSSAFTFDHSLNALWPRFSFSLISASGFTFPSWMMSPVAGLLTLNCSANVRSSLTFLLLILLSKNVGHLFFVILHMHIMDIPLNTHCINPRLIILMEGQAPRPSLLSH